MDTAIAALTAVSGIRTAESTLFPPAKPVPVPARDASAQEEPEKSTAETAAAARELAQKIQENLNVTNISIAFTPYGAKDEHVAIKVVDRETGKVIREIPPEEIQNLYARLEEYAAGTIRRKRA